MSQSPHDSSADLMRRAYRVLEGVSAGLVSSGYLLVAGGYALGLLPGHLAIIIAVGLTTTVYTTLLVVRALRLHLRAAACRGVGFLGMGVLAGGAGLIGGAALTGAASTGHVAAYAVAAGVAPSVVLFLIALLLLPGAAPRVRSRLRRVIDGLAIGTCVFFAGWTLVITPLAGAHSGPAGLHVVIAVALLVLLCTALATVGLIAMRVVRYQASALFCAGGVAVALIEQGTVAMLLLLGAGWHLVLAATAVWALGPMLIWIGARRSATRQPPADTRRRARPGGNFSTLPLLGVAAGLALFGAIYQMVRYGDLGPYTTMLGVLAAFSVGIRESFAGFDLRRYAARVADREARFHTTDPLTGAPNRVRLRHRLETERERVPVGEPCGCLLVVDLDNFGDLDDAAGHDVGDAVLMEVARRLRTSVAASDLAVRLAGDAFAVYTPGTPARATALANLLRVRLAESYPVSDADSAAVHLTVSIGISECASAATVDEMIRCAELAVSSAKERGGGQVHSYDESLELRVLRRQTFAHELRQAVEGAELDVLYAPVMELTSAAAVGLRAELRWRHPKLGVVSSAELADAAEDAGLSAQLGDWTLHQAVRQLGSWTGEGRDLWVSVRVWPVQLRAPRFRDTVLELCRRYQVSPYRLVLELSESGMPSAEAATEPLGALRNAGLATALADFGSGPCSLLELPELPLDMLTVAAPLVAGLGDSEPVVTAVTGLARHLGLDVVADGVAAHWQADLLRTAGCRYATGTLYSRPVPAEHAEAYLDTHAGGTDAQLRP
ncbi:MAG: putative bifunctional diguanylate cyclase/phosphodiesterase [Micromonosporaceae bacterium]